MPREDQAVYVMYPRGVKTGGPEALHQLVRSLRDMGVEAFLSPSPRTRQNPDVPDFDIYDCPKALDIPDAPGVRVVAPEVLMGELERFRHAQTMIWWLSIDDSSLYFGEKLRERDASVRAAGRVVGRRIKRDRKSKGVYRRLVRRSHNLTQSHYAWAHLVIREQVAPSMLSDFTLPGATTRHTGLPPSERGRTVAFNPKKGADLLTEVQSRLPDVAWRPIENLSSQQVGILLRESAIYLDLGHHPGKDRIPREAALAGAIVIVGRRGSAFFHADVPVDDRCKVTLGSGYADRTAVAIEAALGSPEEFVAAQDDYAAAILRERSVFDQEVRDIFVERKAQSSAL